MKETPFELLERTRGEYLHDARETARQLLRKRDYVTIDDIRLVCPPPKGVDPRVMGAVFTPAEFEAIGWIRSSRSECHKRPIQRFRLKQEKREDFIKSLISFRRRHQLVEDIA